MNPVHLHHVWEYNDVDRAFWAEHLAGWLPRRIIDAHTHLADAALRVTPMTEQKRRQHWVNEVSVTPPPMPKTPLSDAVLVTGLASVWKLSEVLPGSRVVTMGTP